jgi:hypothetical protein
MDREEFDIAGTHRDRETLDISGIHMKGSPELIEQEGNSIKEYSFAIPLL